MKDKKEIHSGTDSNSTSRRHALRALVWAAPAVVATAAVKARAQEGSEPGPPIPDE